MSQHLVSIDQAAINAIKLWFAANLPSDVVIDDRWPEPSRALPVKAITILPAGAREQDYVDPQIVSATSLGPSTNNQTYSWLVALIKQPLQLDVWTKSDVDRDDIKARLEPILFAGEVLTLGSYNADPVIPGFTLPLQDGWAPGLVNVYFDTPKVVNDGQAFQRSEYRMTYEGEASLSLIVQAVSPKMATVTLKQKLSEMALASEPSTLQNDITTVTDSAVTTSYGS